MKEKMIIKKIGFIAVWMAACCACSAVSKDPIASGDIYFCKNGFSNLNQMYRIQPEIVYNIGKLNLGLGYQYTAVQYGKNFNNRALAADDLHWVGNHRVQMMVKYNF